MKSFSLNEINIDLNAVDPNYFEVTATNNFGQVIANIGGAEGVIGSRFNDTIFGDDKKNLLGGFGGDDSIFGGIGNDLLVGGSGLDLLRGGQGEDILIDLDGGTLWGDVNPDASVSGQFNDTFFVGSNILISDLDLSSEGSGSSGNVSKLKDVIFVQLTPEVLLSDRLTTPLLLPG